MSKTNDNHPICTMCDTSIHLREQALFVKKQASSSAERAKQASTDIANLKIEVAFEQLHKMVAMLGGKSRHTNATQASSTAEVPMAAE